MVCRILQHRCCGNAYTLLRAARLDEDFDRLPHGKKGQRFPFGCKGERQGLLAQAAGGADEGERDPLVADRKTCRGDIRRYFWIIGERLDTQPLRVDDLEHELARIDHLA